MRIFKSAKFADFTQKEDITNETLKAAISEIEEGLYDASLGGGVYKKRVPRSGQGKSGAYRTIICYREGERAFFVHGFAKSSRDNISTTELKGAKLLAKYLLTMTDQQLESILAERTYIEF